MKGKEGIEYKRENEIARKSGRLIMESEKREKERWYFSGKWLKGQPIWIVKGCKVNSNIWGRKKHDIERQGGKQIF